MVQGKGMLEMPAELRVRASKMPIELNAQLNAERPRLGAMRAGGRERRAEGGREDRESGEKARERAEHERAEKGEVEEKAKEKAKEKEQGQVSEKSGGSDAATSDVMEASRAASRVAAAEAALRACYSSSESERAFKHIVDFHSKQGWMSMNQLES